ncbi:MAG: four helix bundle protein [Deltaproteobacteria bacterium]|nr:four helix bundle protein [Deltaproteobacteria bacterium]
MEQEKKPRDIKERTFTFALKIIRLVQELDNRSGVCKVIGRQVLRSGTSTGANVEEAQAGQSRADFNSKYAIALKEVRETIYWLRLLKESGLTFNKDSDALIQEAGEISRVIGAIIVKSKKSQNG